MPEFVPASRVTRIKSSPSVAAAARVRELKAEGRRILDLTVGEPDFDTPQHIKDAAIAAIGRGETKYTSVTGTPELQKAILQTLQRKTGQQYTAGEITIGGGGKQVIFTAFMATLDRATRLSFPHRTGSPTRTWCSPTKAPPSSFPAARTPVSNSPLRHWQAALTERTKWVILNTPSNPTGAVYSRDELAGLAAVLKEHPAVYVLTDEIYDEIHFGEEPITSLVAVAPELKDRVLVTNGVSKAYAMTGWRLGYAGGPAPLVAAINKLQSQMSSCPSSISQAAAAAALTGDQAFVRESVDVYRERRDAAVSGLNAVNGLQCATPEGAFYAYVNCAGVIGKTTPDGRQITNDEDFTLYLLEAASVAVIQGSAYGLSPYFRISYATGLPVIEESIAAIEKAVQALA